MPMNKRPTRYTVAAVLAGVLLAGTVTVAAAKSVAQLVKLDASRQGLSLQVESGFFDPILKMEPAGKSGLYRIVIEGDGIAVAPGLSTDKLLKEVSAVWPSVRTLHLMKTQSAQGEPGIRLILESSEPMQPQIRANLGNEVQIALIRAASSPAPEESRLPELASTTPSHVSPPEPVVSQPVVTPPRALATGAMLMDSPYPQGAQLQSVYQAMNANEPALQAAFGQLRSGQAKEAEAALKRYLSGGSTPEGTPWAKLLLGMTAMERRDSKAAAKIWRDLVSEHRDFLPAYQRLIGLHLENRAYNDAEVLLSLGLSNWPNDSMLNYQRGLLEEINNRPDQAVEHYTRALQAEPDNPTYHYRLALVELKRKNLEVARYELNRALALSPDDTRLHKMLGYVHTLDKHPDLAMAAYARALNPDVMINYARLLAGKKQIDQAVSIYEAVEAIAPDNPDLLFNLGMLYAEINQKQAAERTLNKFLVLRRGKNDKRTEQAEATLKRNFVP